MKGGELLPVCPSCGKRYRIARENVPSGRMDFTCRQCGVKVPLFLPGEAVVSAGGRRVMVAMNEPELTALALRILQRGGLHGVVAHTGEQALQFLHHEVPDALFLSVVLSDMMGYELIDRVRILPHGGGVPVLLLSSIFRTTRYKRAPSSLYGADDYIEMHHLADLLLPKLENLFQQKEREAASPQGPPRPVPPLPHPSREEEEECRKVGTTVDARSSSSASPMEEAVRRMVRVIVADVALYNEEAFTLPRLEGVARTLGSELEEGRQLLLERFPAFEGDTRVLLLEEVGRLWESRQGSAERGRSHGR